MTSLRTPKAVTLSRDARGGRLRTARLLAGLRHCVACMRSLPSRWRRALLQTAAATAAAVCLVMLVRSAGRADDGQCEYAASLPPVHESAASGALSITAGANGAFPPHMSPSELVECLRRRRDALSRRTRITFVGHSRARQVFEKLVSRLNMPLLSRAESRHRVPFVDQPLEPPWWPHADNNSTCVGVWPKTRDAGQPADAWCSRVAANDLLDMEFRWRHGLIMLLDAVRRLEDGCKRGLCTDVLVINQGLHFIAQSRFNRLLPAYRQQVELTAAYLRRLTARGVRVVWMLEQPGNPRAAGNSANDDTLALNTLLTEMFAGRTPMPGVHVWTSGISAVARFWTRICFGLMPHVNAEEYHVCAAENYHVDNGTVHVLTDQLMRFICDDIQV